MSAGPRSLMQEWRTQSSRTVLEFGKFGSVESHTVQVPDGTVIEDWIWFKVRHDLIEMSSDDTDTVWQTPSFVNVLARDNELRKWVVFRQVKYGISVAMGGETLASVGGYIEQGEDPLDAAKRELQEELGYTSDNWVALTPSGIVADCNRGCGVGYLFLALDAVQVERLASHDDLEEMHVEYLSTDELACALHSGQFKGLSWAHVVSLALLYSAKHNLT
ncbi:Nudix hydrolase domain-containing protein [Plasmodiophora brassicae]